jgi:hypothetical protein
MFAAGSMHASSSLCALCFTHSKQTHNAFKVWRASIASVLLTHLIVAALQPGAYPQSSTLAFTADDSGTHGFTVHWRSTTPNAAVVHGGVAVTGWAPVGTASAVWSAPFPLGITEARQLYVSGQRALPTVLGSGLPGSVKQTAWGYTTTDSTPLTWAAAAEQPEGAGIEFIYTGVGS